MIDLPVEFIKRMKERLGNGFAAFLNSYDAPPSRAIRVNTLKISPDDFKKISPLPLGENVPWERCGFYTSAEGLGKTVAHAAGLYYVQEPSAMCAAPELEVKAGERVLDLCSAPGGKGTQLAQYMNGKGVLVLNEINRERCEILKSNVERLGVKNAVVTCASPEALADVFGGYFDKILVDAPCSGEGMFKKEPNAIPEWSVENIKICAERQARILCCADKMLAAGGRLVYSTCTFANEEDEEQIERFLNSGKNFELLRMKKLMPHEACGEGHFCAVLQKNDGVRNDLKLKNDACGKQSEKLKIYREWESQTLNMRLENVYCDNGQNILLFCNGAPDSEGWAKQKVFGGSGLFLGRYSSDGKRFEPSHRLAMILKAEEAKSVDVDEDTALSYLRGLTFNAEKAQKGWNLVAYKGYPLGWCKVSDGAAKNHLPKGLRI
ncbi:MAG: RsmB/NOP family class I SAM-dependent RNA methyltransferase [Clostridia bacterium]|nr:RsmB/NOP family class I SAM-dependent RNA methyltransferase [Clostridia bacterium]